MNVREVPPRQLHLGPEVLAPERPKALPSELESGLDELNVGSLPEGVVDDGLVLIDSNGARRVDDVASGGRVGVDRVDGAEEELLLKVGEEVEVSLGLQRRENRDKGISFDASRGKRKG